MIEFKFRAEKRDLRLFSGLLIPFSLFIGYLIEHYSGQTTLAWSIGGVLLVAGLVGVVRPEAIRWLFVGWMVLAFPIGWLLSHIVLALVFFGLFWPLGLIARAFGYDPLQVRPADRESYWDVLEQVDDKERYFRQF